jgi:hypothetical protein
VVEADQRSAPLSILSQLLPPSCWRPPLGPATCPFNSFPVAARSERVTRFSVPAASCGSFSFNSFPVAAVSEEAVKETESVSLSILSQLLPAARSRGGRGVFPKNYTFNSFPVAAAASAPYDPPPSPQPPRLSILSQLLPARFGSKCKMPFMIFFQFFPSCCS